MATLLKSLPKALRRCFVPVPNYVQALLEVIKPGEQSLTGARPKQLQRMTGVEIPEDAWNPDTVPPHLRMRFRVVDADDQELAVGRDWAAIQQQLRGAARHSFAALPTPEFERAGVRDWDFGDLPEEVSFIRNGIQLRGYPALVAEPDGTLALRVLDSPARAENSDASGIATVDRLAVVDRRSSHWRAICRSSSVQEAVIRDFPLTTSTRQRRQAP